jgi:uncharacterized membrane protein
MSNQEPIPGMQEERTVYQFFFWSVVLKGAISLFEIGAGLALFFIPPAFIVATAVLVLNHLPIASLQNALMQEVARYTAGTVTFVALYLISRGLIKAVLVFALLKNKIWAYPSSLIVLAGFVVYQVYQIVKDHSLIIVAITLFDLVVMYFIWREWRIVKKHLGVQPK